MIKMNYTKYQNNLNGKAIYLILDIIQFKNIL